MAETPGLNREEALMTVGGDETMLLDFLRMYDEENLNPNALRLHKVKCSAAYVGAKKIYALATELQRKGENKESMDLILRDYMEFLHEAKKVKNEIAQILKRPVSLDITDFDIFEKQIRAALPEHFPESKVSPICHGCNIF